MLRFVLLFFFMAGIGLTQHFIPHLEKQSTEYKNFLKLYNITTVLEAIKPTDESFIDTSTSASETLFTFDTEGNLLKAEFRAFSFVLASIDSFSYDKAGKLKSIVSYTVEGHASEGANITTVREFIYSEKTGVLTKVLHKEIENGKTVNFGSYDYEYDKTGKLHLIVDNTEIVFMGEIMPKCNYIYDSKGNLIKEDSNIRTVEHKYDTAGKLIESVEIMEGLDPYTISFLYNDEGKMMTKKTESLTTFGTAEYMYAATGVLTSIHEKWTYGYDMPPTYLIYSYSYNVK